MTPVAITTICSALSVVFLWTGWHWLSGGCFGVSLGLVMGARYLLRVHA